VISAVDWLLSRRPDNGLSASGAAMYTAAQLIGAILGALLANMMFDLPALQISSKNRISLGHGLAELVATAGLVLLVFALARTGRAALSAAAVGAYIGAAYWFTSSTSFANPAVTIGRIFSDTFAGIAPTSALFFIAAQLVGGIVGLGLVKFFFPDAPVTAGRAVVPRPNPVSEEG
jgi:glycerol uptake facilitator-like aquaporin